MWSKSPVFPLTLLVIVTTVLLCDDATQTLASKLAAADGATHDIAVAVCLHNLHARPH